MVRPRPPRRTTGARSFRQLRRFHHLSNPDEVFGTHRRHKFTRPSGRTSSPLHSDLGSRYTQLKKKGYTLEKLAELTDSSKSYIWELENKNPPRPSGEKIAKIASVLGVTAEYLLDPTETVAVADATDDAFFRKYRRMDPTTKDKIRRMVDLWDDEK
jgi:transcriptional regulator with XRE-family HTH domain